MPKDSSLEREMSRCRESKDENIANIVQGGIFYKK